MKKYGLIGHPLKHSFSYRFFNEKFEKENINAEYNNYDISDISSILKVIKEDSNIEGLNVTIPYKESVIKYLDELDPIAEGIGAINVIKIDRKLRKVSLKGYNTDILGFKYSLENFIDKDKKYKALVLGTGGAAKAVIYGLNQLNIKSQSVSRQENNEYINYNELNKEIIEDYKIIINATPLGTFPNIDNCPDIPYQYLTKEHILYDLVYNPPLTKFLTKGEEIGAKIKNGYEMLEIQALEAWKIWNK